MRRQRSHSLETGTSPVSTEIDVPPLKDFYPHHFINHQHIHQPQQQHTQIGTFGPQLRSSFSSTNRPQVPYNNWNVVPTVGSKVLMGAGQPPNATGGGNNQGVTQMMRQRTREDPTRRPQPQLTPATYRSWQPPQPTSNFYPYYQTLPPHPHQHQPNGANVNGMSGMTSQHQNQHQQHQLPAPPSAPQHNQPQQSYHIHQQTQQQHRPHQVMHYTVPPQQPPSANPVAVPPAGPSQGICAGGQKQSQLSAALASAGKLGPQQHQQQQHHAPIFGTWGENGGVGRVGVGVGTAAGRIKGRQSRLSVDAIPFVPDYYRNGDAAASTVLASVTRKSSTGDIGLALKGRGEESQLSRMMSSLDLASPVLSAPWPIRKSMERRSEPEPINADDTASLSSSMTSDSSVEILISGGATCLPFFITGETPATYSNKKTAPRSHSESPISRASRSRDVDPPRPSDEQQFRPKARSHSAVSVPMETSNFGAPVRGRAFEVLTDRRETADGRSQGEDFISFTASKAITIQPSTERRSPKRPPIVQAKKTRKSLPLTKSTVKISPKDPSSPVAIGKLTEGFTPFNFRSEGLGTEGAETSPVKASPPSRIVSSAPPTPKPHTGTNDSGGVGVALMLASRATPARKTSPTNAAKSTPTPRKVGVSASLNSSPVRQKHAKSPSAGPQYNGAISPSRPPVSTPISWSQIVTANARQPQPAAQAAENGHQRSMTQPAVSTLAFNASASRTPHPASTASVSTKPTFASVLTTKKLPPKPATTPATTAPVLLAPASVNETANNTWEDDIYWRKSSSPHRPVNAGNVGEMKQSAGTTQPTWVSVANWDEGAKTTAFTKKPPPPSPSHNQHPPRAQSQPAQPVRSGRRTLEFGSFEGDEKVIVELHQSGTSGVLSSRQLPVIGGGGVGNDVGKVEGAAVAAEADDVGIEPTFGGGFTVERGRRGQTFIVGGQPRADRAADSNT